MMKSLIASIILMILVIALTVSGSVFLHTSLTDLEQCASNIDAINDSYSEIYSKALLIEESFKKTERFANFILDDDDRETLKEYLEDIKSAAEAESREGILTAKSRLISEIEKTRRLCTFSIDAVF